MTHGPGKSADEVYFSPRMDHDKQCVLVTIAVEALGNREIVGMVNSYRESAQSWKELLHKAAGKEKEIEVKFSISDVWSRQLFVAFE